MTILEVQQLSKAFKKHQVLDDISFTIKKGRIYGLIGVNGAGKSTLMKCITGLSYPSAGSIKLHHANIGCMIEAPAIEPAMTAKENLTFQRYLRGIPNEELEDQLLQTVGLQDAHHKKAKDFSLGMKQRLGIAIALLSNPELLILDEPVNGLDPIGVVEMRNLFKKLCDERGMTMIISSHNLPELYQTATDYLILHKGKLIKQLTIEQLDEACRQYILIDCDNPAHCSSVLETVLKFSNFKVLPSGVIKLYEGLTTIGHISTTLVQHGVVLTKYGLQGDTLENYFLSLIGGEVHV